eukprot:jgi/Tetstr1/466549/TSEL_011053.t1
MAELTECLGSKLFPKWIRRLDAHPIAHAHVRSTVATGGRQHLLGAYPPPESDFSATFPVTCIAPLARHMLDMRSASPSRAGGVASCLLLLLLAVVAAHTHGEDIPPAISCRICEVCAIDSAAAEGAPPQRRLLSSTRGASTARRHAVGQQHAGMVAAAPGVLHWYGRMGETPRGAAVPSPTPSGELPHCALCRGCTHKLAPYQGSAAPSSDPKSTTFAVEPPDGDDGGQQVVGTVWCAPGAGRDDSCAANGTAIANRAIAAQLAAARINADCGFDAVVPRVWVEEVTVTLPGSGLTYSGPMVMSAAEAGLLPVVEVQLLRAAPQAALLAALESADVVLAALHDVLLPAHSRHPGLAGVVRGPGGEPSGEWVRLRLLGDDSPALLSDKWAPNSFLLPSTERHQHMLFGHEYVSSYGRKFKELLPEASPLLSLDYRCHTPVRNGLYGYIGRSFPEPVGRCLRRIDGMTAQQLAAHYEMPDAGAAAGLKRRASALLRDGAEGALASTADRPCSAFYWHRPCCKWKVGPSTIIHRGRVKAWDKLQCAYKSWKPSNFVPKLPCDMSPQKIPNPYPDSPLHLNIEEINEAVAAGVVPPAEVLPSHKRVDATLQSTGAGATANAADASASVAAGPKSLARAIFEQNSSHDYLASVPHVSSCGFCGRCLFNETQYKGQLVAPDLSDADLPAWLKHPRVWEKSPEAESYLGTHIDLRRTASTHCPVCTGCTHVFSKVQPADEDMLAERERSAVLPAAQFFQAGTPGGRKQIARLWCLPFAGAYDTRCDAGGPEQAGIMEARHMAADAVRRECGFSDVVSPLWLEDVRTVLPGSGMVVTGKVLMMSASSSDYVSLRKLVALGPSATHATLRRLRSDSLRAAAVHDLLLGATLRHTGAVMVSAGKRRVLLMEANDQLLAGDGVNSALLPGTELYQWNVYGRSFSRGTSERPITRNALLTSLDYRCHVDGQPGAKARGIGTDYSPQEAACLQRLSSLPADGMERTFALDGEAAERLQRRAQRMLDLGFEGALVEAAGSDRACMQRGGVEPRNVTLQGWAPCCSWVPDRASGDVRCAKPRWQPLKMLRAAACFPAKAPEDGDEGPEEAAPEEEPPGGPQERETRMHGVSESSEAQAIVAVRDDGARSSALTWAERVDHLPHDGGTEDDDDWDGELKK